MTAEWTRMFDAYGIKLVTKTDKGKAAYVLNNEQRLVLEGAGISPATTKPAPGFPVTVLFDDRVRVIEASYYHSEREGAGRPPEPRMGHSIISSWLHEGDNLCLGRIGSQLFAAKVRAAPADIDVARLAIVERTNTRNVLQNARRAVGRPPQRTVPTEVYVRNPWVIRAAILRSNGACELPNCRRPLFIKDDGTVYLEVHHVTPLSEDGDDTLDNVAALCPSCHRELHFGVSRDELRRALRTYLSGISG